MQAFASSVIQRRARSYSTPCIITWLYVATPPMPSMSTEIHTLCATRLGTARWYEVAQPNAFAIELVSRAGVAELVDAMAPGAIGPYTAVGVQIPPSALDDMATPLRLA